MRAVVVEAHGSVGVIDVPEPVRSGNVLVAVREVGICGTDLKIIDGDVAVDVPRILGHEMMGQVLDAGDSQLVKVGERVLIDPSVACGYCVRCRRGHAHLCRHGGLMGRDLDGLFAERVELADSQLLPVPNDLPWEHGPLLQILGTCVHGQSLIEADPGQVAVVVGLGVSGLLQVQLLRARGVDIVVGVTRSEQKLRLGEQLGATHVARPGDAEQLVAELTAGEGADVVVESSGSLAGLRSAVELARPGATVLLFGTISAVDGEFPYYLLYAKELALVSSRAALPRDYAAAIDHVASGRVRVAPLLTQRFPLDEAEKAVATFRDGSGVLKVTMTVDA